MNISSYYRETVPACFISLRSCLYMSVGLAFIKLYPRLKIFFKMEEIVPKKQDNPIFIVNLILCMHEFKHIENNALYTNEKSLFFLIHEQVDDVVKNA